MSEKIKMLRYKQIDKGFFEVYAETDIDKIAFEGNMCGGLLKEFIKRVKTDGGKAERVKYKVTERELFKENQALTKQLGDANKLLKGMYEKINTYFRN